MTNDKWKIEMKPDLVLAWPIFDPFFICHFSFSVPGLAYDR